MEALSFLRVSVVQIHSVTPNGVFALMSLRQGAGRSTSNNVWE